MNQHRVSQVYLKLFGYKENNGQWKVSAYPLQDREKMVSTGREWMNQVSIETLTAEWCIFDFDEPVGPGGTRILEKMFSELENEYGRIVNLIRTRTPLGRKDRSMLVGFVASLATRHASTRDFINDGLNGENKTGFVDSITKLMELEHAKFYGNYIMNATGKDELNMTLLAFMDVFINFLFKFELGFFLAGPEGWITSDEPVTIRYNDDEGGDLFSLNTEFFFPLCPQVLLYMHHAKADRDTANIFRTAKGGAYAELTEEEEDSIERLIFMNAVKYVFSIGKDDGRWKLDNGKQSGIPA